MFFCEGGGDPNGTDEEIVQWKQGEWRRQVLAARWPGVPIYDDVRAVGVEPAAGTPDDGRGASGDGAGWLHSGAVPDLLCGGFPCQDLSVAGKRAGLAGDRSGLFFEFARIIDLVRPRWVLLENVPGLLSSQGGRDFGTVLGTLADLGYGLGWRVLDSRFFGVPQRRRRVFIVGARADGDPATAARRAGEVLAVGSRCPGHPPTGSQTGEDVTAASPISTLTSHKAGGWRVGADEAAGGQLVAPVSYALNAKRGNRDDGESETFIPATSGVRRLTPVECERLQGLPDNWTRLDDKTPDSRRYSALGDAVTANVAEWIGGRLACLEGLLA